MLRDENRGISGNGQKSYKRYKYKTENGKGSSGGGAEKKGIEYLELVHYHWNGQGLEAPRIGGVGVIPIEDQFKATSNQTGTVYESIEFEAIALVKSNSTEIHISGMGTDTVFKHYVLQLEPGDAVMVDEGDKIHVVWIEAHWVKKIN